MKKVLILIIPGDLRTNDMNVTNHENPVTIG